MQAVHFLSYISKKGDFCHRVEEGANKKRPSQNKLESASFFEGSEKNGLI